MEEMVYLLKFDYRGARVQMTTKLDVSTPYGGAVVHLRLAPGSRPENVMCDDDVGRFVRKPGPASMAKLAQADAEVKAAEGALEKAKQKRQRVRLEAFKVGAPLTLAELLAARQAQGGGSEL